MKPQIDFSISLYVPIVQRGRVGKDKWKQAGNGPYRRHYLSLKK